LGCQSPGGHGGFERHPGSSWEAAIIAVVICLAVIVALGIGFAIGLWFTRLRRDKGHDSY
jgi:hypothetical protein